MSAGDTPMAASIIYTADGHECVLCGGRAGVVALDPDDGATWSYCTGCALAALVHYHQRVRSRFGPPPRVRAGGRG